MVDVKPDQNVPVLSFNLVMDILSKVEKFCRQEESCKNAQRELDTMVEQNLFFLRASNDSEAESLKVMDEHVFVTAVLKIFLPQERLEFRQAVLKQVLPLLMLTAVDLDCVPILQSFVPWMVRGCGGQSSSWLKGCIQKVWSTYLCTDEMDEYVARLAKVNTSCPTFAHTLLPLMISEQEYFEMLPLSALQLAADWLNEDPESVAKTVRLCLPPNDQSSQKLTLNYVDKLSWLCIVHDLNDDEQFRPVLSKLRLGILKLMMRINEDIDENSPRGSC
ncbi:Carbonyl reductase family member [Trichinella spiralis]|uniref:Carbonyl reductase family member n=1 Tax=Trichinella spiralis TaxID=6334 RepID=A0ABR3KCQ4_TRISP